MDVTHDSCLTAANFRSIAAYFDQKPSIKHQTSRLLTGRRSFNIKPKKVPYQLQMKKVAKNYDSAAGFASAYSDQDLHLFIGRLV